MRRTIWKSVAAALLGTLLFAAPALAANPAQDAYGATSGSLPFTGINLVAILAVAIAMLSVGVFVRVRAARSH